MPPPSLGRLGALEVRLARSAEEIRRAQRLRYGVFVEEGAAVPSPYGRTVRRDIDVYDSVCEHLLVLDHDVPAGPFRAAKPKVVGTYRLLRQERAARAGGFYAAHEYEVAGLLERHPDRRFVELGRSCVARAYRNRRTIELLWAGIWAYVRDGGDDAMIGCASFEGTDPDRLAVPLAFLARHAASPAAWTVWARPDRREAMDRLPGEPVDAGRALRELPPLVRAYLRLGATFGDGAVVDRAFGTTDVFVVLPIEFIAARYLAYFGDGVEPPAA